MSSSRDELRSPDLLSSTRGRVIAASLVVLVVAVVAIAALRPDRQGVGTPLVIASPSAGPSPSASPSPSLEPTPSPQPSSMLSPIPPTLTADTGSRLVVVQGTRMELLDHDGGRRSTIAVDDRLRGHDRIDVVSVGRELVLLGDDQTGAGNGPYPAYATTAGEGSSVRKIGEASNLIPSNHAGRVWLSQVTDGFRVGDNTIALTTLDEVDLRGRVYQHARFEGSFGADPFAGGYLRQTVMPDKREGDDVELVDAAGKRRLLYKHVSVLLVSGNTALVADRVACQKKCDLHVLTAASTVSERVLHLGPTPDLLEAGITNDGSRLFVGVRQDSADPAPSIVSELSLKTGAWRPVTGAWAATYYGASYTFSADGHWMFFVDADERHIDAYDLTARRAYRVNGDFAQITQLELL